MPSLKLLDHINLKSRLSANFACSYSEDGKISIITETGVYILTLKGYVENPFPRFSLRKDHIKVTNKLISDYLHIDLSTFISKLPRDLLYDLILDDCGRSTSITGFEAKPIRAKWSPRGLIGKTDCALAVLTNLKNLEIYVKSTDQNEIVKFECVSHALKYVSDFYKGKWRDISEFPVNESKYTELKQRATLITPTGFEWSHLIEKDGKTFCILFISHKNGSISAWKFNEKKFGDTDESKLEYLGRYNTNLKQITAINWHKNKNTAGGLTLGDKEGKICSLCVSKLTQEKIKFDDEVLICEDEDFQVDKILVINLGLIHYLIAVKQNYLFVYVIDENAEISNAAVYNFGNLFITGIYQYKDNTLIVLDLSGLLKLIKLNYVEGKINFEEELLVIESDLTKFRTHGFVLSPNKVFYGILMFPSQLKDFGKKDYVNFLIFSNSDKHPLQILWKEPKENLRDYWDCFETLRVMSITEKRFPWQRLEPNLNYDQMSLLQLKILRWIAKMSEKIYHLVPFIPEYNIKAYVLLNYAVDIKLAMMRMRKLLNIHFTSGLSVFQFRSLDLLNFFLKEMVAKDVLRKANLGETFIDEMYEVMSVANELEYPDMPQCIWCGQKIIGTSCVPFHADSRCSISLMPISLVPGYKCPFCKCIVSKEMEQEYFPIFCPYCDVAMEPRISPIYPSIPDVVKLDCYSDCLAEEAEDPEEPDHEFLILTDSDDDAEDVKKTYERIRKMVIQEENKQVEEPDNDNDEIEEQ